MPNIVVLSEAELQVIRPLVAAARATGSDYWKVYEKLADLLESKGFSPSHSTVLWLRGATEANANRGAFSELIRIYTETQYKLRYPGQVIPDGLMQRASDKVAENLIQNLLGELEDSIVGGVPDIGDIAEMDAIGVGQVLFGAALGHDESDTAYSQNSAWSGSLLFSLLNSNQTFRLMNTGDTGEIDTLSDLRDVLFAYMAYAEGIKAAAIVFAQNAAVAALIPTVPTSAGEQCQRDALIMGQTLTSYMTSGGGLSGLKDIILDSTDDPVLKKAFSVIGDVSPPKFVDMIMGAVLGKCVIGGTTDQNIDSTINAFFGELSPARLQSISVALLPHDKDSLIGLAKSDVNVRSALEALSTVSVSINEEVAQKFTRYDMATDEGKVTDSWIEDRAAMLSYLMERDTDWVPNVLQGNTLVSSKVRMMESWVYTDAASGQTLNVKAPMPSLTEHRVIFGSLEADSYSGGSGNDHFYGGDGDDFLKGDNGFDYLEGNDGNDTLEGGKGNDALLGMQGNDILQGGKGDDELHGGKGSDEYLFEKGDGGDVIQDTDGLGSIKIGGVVLTGGEKTAWDTWRSADKQFTYTKRGATVMITTADGAAGNIIYIEDFESGNLGIDLNDPEAPPSYDGIVFGDVDPETEIKTRPDGSEYEEYIRDAFGNFTGVRGSQSRADELLGSSIADEMFGDVGNDAIYSGNGDDSLNGGVGDDLLVAGLGEDHLYGGDDNDILLGDAEFSGSPDHLARLDIMQASDSPPPHDGAIFLSSGVGWIRYSSPFTSLDPVSNSNPDAINSVLYQLSRDRFGSVHIYGAPVTEYGQGVGGVDVIEAGAGSDRANGGAGNDFIYGEAGEDYLFGASGSDYVDGGTENDVIFGDAVVYAEFLWRLNDIMGPYRAPDIVEEYEGEFGNDRLLGGDGDDYLFGMAGSDIIFGDEGNDYLVGDFFDIVNIPILKLSESGDAFVQDTTEHFEEAVRYHGIDRLYGGAGDDYIIGLAGDDFLYGQDDRDVLLGDGNPDEVQGHYGKDYLDGGAANDFLQGSGGGDELYGGTGDDELWGDEYAGANGQPVTSWGGAPVNSGSSTAILDVSKHGLDHMEGGEGNDVLTGGGFGDVLYGQAGNDLLYGDGIGVTGEYEGKDTLYGGAGDDQLQGNGNDDHLYGGEGIDKLYGQEGNDYLIGDSGDDYLEGGMGEDTLEGGDGIDTLWGNENNDILVGGAGNDLITGGADNDTLTGGVGRDYLDGGDGNDIYVLKAGDGEIIDNTFEMMVDSSGVDTLRLDGVDPSAIVIRQGTVSSDVAIQYGANDGIYIKGGLMGAVDIVEFVGGITQTFGEFLVNRMEDALSLAADSSGSSVYGGKGNDSLTSFNVNTVVGGAGNDSIIINGGGNTIFMRRGDGVDTIDWGNGPSSPTRVRFDKGIKPTDLQIFPSGSSDRYYLNIRIDGNPNNALVFAGFSMNHPMDYSNAVGYFDFTNDDGSIFTLTYDEMLSGGFIYPFTEGRDLAAGTSLNDTFDGLGGNDYIRGGEGNDVVIGGDGNDSLYGDDGNDTLRGGVGNDYLSGGSGIDTYLFDKGDGIDSIDSFNNPGDVVSLAYNANELVFRNLGKDLIMSSLDGLDQVKISYYFNNDGGGLSAGIDILFADGVHYDYAAASAKALEGTSGDDFIIGMDRGDTIAGLAGNDTLGGGSGDDILDGGVGDDVLALDAGNDTYVFGVGSGHDQIEVVDYVPTYDGVGSDTIFMSGLAASQVMVTRFSADLMVIKVLDSDDWISFSSSGLGFADLKVRFADGMVWTSTDLNAKASLSEGNDVLNLLDTDDVLDVLGGNDIVNANGGDDFIWGSGGNDILNGGAGNDSLYGGIGDDTLSGGVGQDYLFGDDGNDKLSGGDGDDWLYAGNGADSLDGGNGSDSLLADTLDGAKDTLTGGADNDNYYISESVDSVVEVDGGGYDVINYLEGGVYTIPLWIERAQYNSGVSIKITGNSQNNFFDVQYSTSKNTLVGGSGNDTYYYVDTADVITESKSGGVDTVYMQATSYSLAGTNLENAVIVRPTGSVYTVQAWSLYGTSAANYLSIEDGFGLSAYGYDGNDTLEGCWNSSSYGVYDYLDGGNGDDILNGRGGSGDTLVGGAGNDTYHVYSFERLTEAANAGSDTVIAYLDYTLSTNFENLTLAESDTALKGTGNAVVNKITGNSYDNVLDGGDGADTLIGGDGNDTLIGGIGVDSLFGGLGDDTFFVDNTGDVIQESAGQGSDSVRSSVTYTLVANLENLTLTGAGTISGTGNALANRLRGNSAGNALTGMAGNDTYLFGRGEGADVVLDNDSTAGNQDLLLLDAGIAHDQLWFKHVGTALEVSVIGTSDKVTINNWYNGSANHVERIQTADGHYLLDTQIELLVQAMAGMTSPAIGQTDLTSAQHQQLDAVFAASWQAA